MQRATLLTTLRARLLPRSKPLLRERCRAGAMPGPWAGPLAALGVAAVALALAWAVPRWMDRAAEAAGSAVRSSGALAPDNEAAASTRARLVAPPRAVRFEPNRGQAAKSVRYLSRGPQHEIALFDDGMAISLPTRGAAAQLRFVGAARDARFEERAPASSVMHHLRGSDPQSWQRALPQFMQIRQAGLYPGIDLVYYSRDGEFEFDFVVHPGADPAPIRLRHQGSQAALIDAEGRLRLDGPEGSIRVKRPTLTQNIDGRTITHPARWVRHDDGSFGFELPAYDRSRVLVIDPAYELLYSSYAGGVHDDQLNAMVLDAAGNAYVVGQSGSEDWPVSANAWQTERRRLGVYVRNVVVSKFDPAGTLLWSTFIGGDVNDYGRSIAVDARGQVIVSGMTQSSNFPTTADALQRQFFGSQSGFISVLSPDGGSLVHSTLYGGNGGADVFQVVLDSDGRLWATGTAGTGLPTTAGSYKPTLAGGGSAGFVARFSAPAAGPLALQAASYYGIDNAPADRFFVGSTSNSLALTAGGAVWITGQARHELLPLTTDSLQPRPAAPDHNAQIGALPLCAFAYVARLSADLSGLEYATYLTGATREARDRASCAEYGRSLALLPGGDLLVTGSTASDRFPTTTGALQSAYPGAGGGIGHVGFATRLSANGRALVWSTYLGGRGGDTFVNGLALEPGGTSLWVYAATSGGAGFPLSGDAQQAVFGGGTYDGSLTRLAVTDGSLQYGSYAGGSGIDSVQAVAIDAQGGVFVAGATDSRNFPVTANAAQAQYTPNSFDGNDWFLRVMGSGTISRVLPASAGNAGDASVQLSGVGFRSGATCALAGNGQTLAAVGAVPNADGTSMVCEFALAGAALGRYDVQVLNADGTRFARPGAFEVMTGQGPDVSVEVLGRPTIRTGVPSEYQVVVSNEGDADAIGVVLVVRYSAGLRPVDPSRPDPFGLSLIPVPRLSSGDTENYALNPLVRASTLEPGVNVVTLLLPVVAPHTSKSFSFKLLSAADSDDEFVEAYVHEPLATTQSTLRSANRLRPALVKAIRASEDGSSRAQGLSKECLDELWKIAWDKATGKIPGVDCFRDLNRTIAEIKFYQNSHPGNQAAVLGDVVKALFKQGTDCAELAGIELAAIVEAVKRFMDMMEDIDNLAKLSDKCKDKDPNKDKNKKRKKKKTKSKGAIDPNDKSGPLGDDSAARWTRKPGSMGYQIAFENLASASLPAAEVVVTDRLDPAKFDLATLRLGDITWGTQRISVPAGSASFATVHAIDATLAVRVAASLDPATGVLKWTFVTLDRATRLPPSDPTLGFLPPNRNGTEGQAYVHYTIQPKAGLPEGTRWENTASIVFDANAPIVTPTWVNSLDTTAPSSRITAATQKPGTSDVEVSWSATDTGSGVAAYTVYVSENGGAYSVWRNGVTETSGTLLGVNGSRYAFYVQASDRAGNQEAAKTAPEATVLVGDAGAAGGGGGGGGCTMADPSRRTGDASLVLLLLAALGALGWRRGARS